MAKSLFGHNRFAQIGSSANNMGEVRLFSIEWEEIDDHLWHR
jgi:hypothetical protein